MKKMKAFLTLGLALGAFSGASLALNKAQEMKTAKATDPETYIEMEEEFFTNWNASWGNFRDAGATFWAPDNYSFEALDRFYCGEGSGTNTGTLTSRQWDQGTQYVYFQLGAAKNFGHDPEDNKYVHLTFHYGSYSRDFYNDTFVENPMTLRYFKIPDEQFAALKALGDTFKMSVDIVDPNATTDGYDFASFGYLHVNQTKESTGDAMRYFLNHLSTDSREWEINKRREIFNSYWSNGDQKEVFFASAGTNINDSFSTNADFLNHWYFDYNYFNNNGDARHFDTAIGTDDFRPDTDNEHPNGTNANNMPFNNDGNFFRGWYENAEGHKTGFTASDALKYRFISRPFTLSGTGIVSIKMAGKASLQVLDATVQNTLTTNETPSAADLAWADNHAMNTSGSLSNIAESGFNTVTMVNHVINLEAYVGRKIQLAIADIDTSGWSAAYFDELVTYYESAPAYHIDVCTQTNNDGTFYPAYADIYVNSKNFHDENNKLGIKYNGSNTVNTVDPDGEGEQVSIINRNDISAYKAAHEVWKSYIDTVRGGNQGRNYCTGVGQAVVSDDVKAVINSYNGLSEAAKRIVCSSDDFERVGAGDWYTINPTIYASNHAQYSIGNSLAYLARANSLSVVVYSNGYAMSYSPAADATPMFIISAIVVVGSFIVLFFALRKKKENN